MEKITKREMFEAIIEGVEAGSFKYDVEDIKAFCENEIALLDKKAAKAKEAAAKKRAEGDELTDAVRAVLTNELATIADITAKVTETFEGEVTVARVQYRLGQLVKNGEAAKDDVKVTGADGAKARTIKAYKLAD